MFDRLEILIGENNIKKINNLTVAVIGLGGVGGYAVESLTRLGIKRIIIVDYDTIDITNLNRQIIADKYNIGNKKVDEFEKRIKKISDVDVIKLDVFLDENNIDLLFKYDIDFIIDACDTVKTKIEIIRNALDKKIKFISCMGTGNRQDPTKLKIDDITKTSYDPLARKVRKLIKDEHIIGKVPVVFSTEEPIKTKKVGSNSYVPGAAGLLCTSYIVKEVLR